MECRYGDGRSWRVCLTGLFCLGGVSPVMAGQATESVQVTIDEVLKILNDKELKTPAKQEDRRQRLEKVVAARFDSRNVPTFVGRAVESVIR